MLKLKEITDPINILLIEDNLAHAELFKRELEDNHFPCHIVHVSDGDEALKYLLSDDKQRSVRTEGIPHIVFLDLRLPKIDGLEVLKEIKFRLGPKMFPVVILTSSSAEKDVQSVSSLDIYDYIVKPAKFKDIENILNRIYTHQAA